jgi:hypothetical protein
MPGVVDEVDGIDQHAHRDKKDHGKEIAEGDDLSANVMADRRFAQHHTGQKRAQRQRDTK